MAWLVDVVLLAIPVVGVAVWYGGYDKRKPRPDDNTNPPKDE